MKKALGTMILLAASAGTLITPAMAADRNVRDYTERQTTVRRTYVVNRGHDARVRAVRFRNERDRRDRRDRDDYRAVYDRDWR